MAQEVRKARPLPSQQDRPSPRGTGPGIDGKNQGGFGRGLAAFPHVRPDRKRRPRGHSPAPNFFAPPTGPFPGGGPDQQDPEGTFRRNDPGTMLPPIAAGIGGSIVPGSFRRKVPSGSCWSGPPPGKGPVGGAKKFGAGE